MQNIKYYWTPKKKIKTQPEINGKRFSVLGLKKKETSLVLH